MPTDCLTKMRTQDQETHVLIVADSSSSVKEIILCERFNMLAHLLSVTAFVLKFIQALKQAINGHHSRSPETTSRCLLT